MKGRKPYPYELVEATNDTNRYTKEALRNRKACQPQIRSAKLSCPRHLSTEARKEWKRIVALYRELRSPILNDLDRNALEVYCEAVATYRKAIAKVRETSEVYVSRNDNRPRKNPWLAVANEAAMQIRKYGELLLLDPVSRARASLAKPQEEKKTGMALFLEERAKRRGQEGPPCMT